MIDRSVDEARRARAARVELEKAERVLVAEQSGGCQDRLVIGGLAGFAAGLRDRVGQLGDPSVTLVADQMAGLLADYATLNEVERKNRVERALLGVRAGLHVAGGPPLLRPASPPSVRPGQPPARPTRGSAATPAPPGGEAASTASILAIPRLSPPVGVTLDTPLSALKGIGPQRARVYGRLELRAVRDLLFHMPLRHVPFPAPRRIADLFFQAEGSVVGTVERMEVEHLPRSLKKLRAIVRDDSGSVEAVWLRHGQPRLGVRPGEAIALSGKLLQLGRHLTFDNPEYERGDAAPLHTRRLVPVYPLTAGLSDKELRGRIHWAISHFAGEVVDPLPDALRLTHGLPRLDDALRDLHFPPTHDAYERARRRFAFEELLTIQIVVLQRRLEWQEVGAPPLPRREDALAALAAGLPFALTGAQRRVLDEILADTAQPRPMTRLLQGEVGSGKTAVAAMALVNAVANGQQGALMAPTEILAEQHYRTLTRFFERASDGLVAALGRDPTVKLLTGSVKGKERAAVYAGVQEGSVNVLVGTQALIQQSLDFGQLGLVIVDEQHRFGVKQRVTLRQKGQLAVGRPHLLVMTATPIPRTLALSLYGDLDLSVIDEMPPGRQDVKTVLLGESERHLAHEKVRRAVAQGRQAFIICPLVEESEILEAKAATEEFERLRNGELAGLRLALLHGRMKAAEKDTVMRAFRDRAYDVLVSTAVVEVGVDVPNATVMLIEGAERFGLAQLHQFRGRVGRGEHASVCMLLTDVPDPHANERLRVVERSNNGLELAEHDLRLRGPGDYFGVRQSGFPELKVARLDDALLVESGRSAAADLLARDPRLERPEHAALRAHLEAFMARVGEPS